MPLRLEGSCACGAIRFSVDSHAPCPYQLCYCSICCRTGGGGGFAVNLSAQAHSLNVSGKRFKRVFHAPMAENGQTHLSSAERHFCSRCGTSLWLFSPEWPELLHPMASAIDSELPTPPNRVHMMLGSKAPWVQADIAPDDQCFEAYPAQSIEAWHRERGLWID